MTNFKKYCAFTLSELLLSIIIVGVIAIITVPTLINNVQKKVFATQVKNFVAQLEQLAQDELITHRTRDISNTDFSNPALILSDKHFSISKSCTSQNAPSDCWKTTAQGKNKISYKLLNGKNFDYTGAKKTIILNNGIMFGYGIESVYKDKVYAYFLVDINGNDKPNIAGRDLFAFYMDRKGHIRDYYTVVNPSASHSTKIINCKSSSTMAYFPCFSLLVDNNWKMDY